MKIKLLLGLLLCVGIVSAQPKQISITIDDLPFVNVISVKQAKESTFKLLGALEKAKVPTVGFVNEAGLYKSGEVDEWMDILETWLIYGQELGNHTFSHVSINNVSFNEYKVEVIKGDVVSSMLAKKHNSSVRYFRYPFLHSGADSLTKYSFLEFLKSRNYISAPVTIDTEDYIFNKSYVDAFKAGDKAKMTSVASQYLDFLDMAIPYYEALSLELVNRPIRHILLCHANLINSDHFAEVIDLLRRKGYAFITLDEALKDPVYERKDPYIGRSGWSWLHRWALTDRLKFKTKEPQVPDDIMKAWGQ